MNQRKLIPKTVVLNRCSTESQGFGEPASGVRQRSSEM